MFLLFNYAGSAHHRKRIITQQSGDPFPLGETFSYKICFSFFIASAMMHDIVAEVFCFKFVMFI